MGIRIVFHLGDTIIMAQSHTIVLKHRDIVVALLGGSLPCPSFCLPLWDTSLGTVFLMEEKMSRLQADAHGILSKSRVTCHELQRFLGCTNFAGVAVGNWFIS